MNEYELQLCNSNTIGPCPLGTFRRHFLTDDDWLYANGYV